MLVEVFHPGHRPGHRRGRRDADNRAHRRPHKPEIRHGTRRPRQRFVVRRAAESPHGQELCTRGHVHVAKHAAHDRFVRRGTLSGSDTCANGAVIAICMGTALLVSSDASARTSRVVVIGVRDLSWPRTAGDARHTAARRVH